MALKRGRPPTKVKVPPKNKVTKIICSSCGKDLPLTDFYNSNSKFAKANKFDVCKTCLKKKIKTDDIQTVYDALMAMDAPFLIEYWEIAKSGEDVKFPFGNYVRMINTLSQFRGMTWKDSLFEYEIDTEKQTLSTVTSFKLTDDIIDFFGAGYTPEEYEAMYRKYNFLKNNYPEKTAMHIESLKTYCKFKVREEFATAEGDVAKASKWADMAQKAATSAKINPNQLSAADLQNGLSTFGQLVRAVEQAVDIIPVLPTFKEKPKDKVDFTLFCYINYIRDLKGLPLCNYDEIYAFYEERKKEYSAEYEFLTDEPEEDFDKSVGDE